MTSRVHIVAPGSPHEGRRDTAAWALGEIGDARAFDPLLDAVAAGVASAAFAVGRLRDPRAFEPLLEALANRDVDARCRASAARGLGALATSARSTR